MNGLYHRAFLIVNNDINKNVICYFAITMYNDKRTLLAQEDM